MAESDVLGAIERLDGRLARLESGVAQLDVRLGGVELGVSRLSAGQLSVETSLTRLRVELMERIDRLQEKVTQLGDESVVNYASSSTVGKKLQSQEDQARDTTDQLAAMFRMLKRLDARMNAIEEKH